MTIFDNDGVFLSVFENDQIVCPYSIFSTIAMTSTSVDLTRMVDLWLMVNV